EALEDLGKERRTQIATALKEGLGTRLDPRVARIPALQRVGQGLTQRLRGPQHDRRPEADQCLEGPYPLPLGRPHRAEHRPTQGRRDVRLQQIHHSQQIDRLRAPGHSPSWRWGCYASVNPTSGDLPASYLSGDDVKTTFRRNPDYFRAGLPWVDGVDWLVMEDDAAGLAAYRTGQLDAGPNHWWSLRQPDVAAVKKSHPELVYQDFLSNVTH